MGNRKRKIWEKKISEKRLKGDRRKERNRICLRGERGGTKRRKTKTSQERGV